MTVTVSVNSYQDAELLQNCLASIRQELPHARIQVIDGRYETFEPDAPDNSTDDTEAVCDAYGAEYWPDGPHEDEQSKHWQRIERAPNDERVLFIDADERLMRCDTDGLDEEAAYCVRIFNALMYEQDVTYYPRYFYPGMMEDIPRVDRFSFAAPVERTDRVTIVHRADLRSDEYRAAKVDRFDREGRGPWYKDYLERLQDQGDWRHVDFCTCPECGTESLTRSRVCGYDGDRFTWVEACTNADGCYRAIREYTVDEYRYVPDRIEVGFEEDIMRVRVELMKAGNDIARVIGPEEFGRYEQNAVQWARDEYATP